MNTLAHAAAPVKFDSRRPCRNAVFGLGIYPQKPVRLPVGPTEADRAWAAAMLNRDSEGTTEFEDYRLGLLTMTPGEYRSLQYEISRYDAMARDREEYECDQVNLALASEGF